MNTAPQPIGLNGPHKRLTGRQRAFLGAYAVCATIKGASRASTVPRSTHRRWLAGDPAYATAFHAERRLLCDQLEEVARDRAINGVRKLKFDKFGQPLRDERGNQYEERVYSDVLLIFLLKANNPEKFRTADASESTTEPQTESPDDWYGQTIESCILKSPAEK